MNPLAAFLCVPPRMRDAAAVVATALLSGLYVQGGAAWPLGFLALVPWFSSLEAQPSLARALASAWAMSVAFTLAVFAWFGSAIGAFTHWGDAPGLALLLAAAPLFQPQFLAFALVRHVVGRRHGGTLVLTPDRHGKTL